MSQAPDTTVSDIPLPSAVGYVHFIYDNHSLARLSKISGWAYFNETRYELQSIDELPKDHVWLSNLSWVEHKSIVGDKRPYIKSNRFFPLTLEQIKHELALEEESENEENFARILVALGENLLRLCIEAYKEPFLSNLRYQPTFAQTIAVTIGLEGKKQPNTTDELHTKIIWENVYEQTYITKKPDPKKPIVCFRMPMYRHAEQLVRCPLPSEEKPWVEVKVPASSLDSFFERTETPSVVEITEFKLPKLLEDVYPQKQGAGGRYHRDNFWLPSIEAAFLRKIGHLEVGRVFVQPAGYVQETAWSKTVPAVKGCLQLSYSAQMLSHAHFLSAATQVDEQYWPMHSWWVRSMDRMLMIFAIMPIAAIEGIQVVSYGEGCLFLQGDPDSISAVIEMGPSLGLVPTQSAWRAGNQEKNEEIRKNPLWLSDDYSVYEKTAIQLSSREIGLTLKLDDAALLSLSSQEMANEALTQIMRGITHGKSY